MDAAREYGSAPSPISLHVKKYPTIAKTVLNQES